MSINAEGIMPILSIIRIRRKKLSLGLRRSGRLPEEVAVWLSLKDW